METAPTLPDFALALKPDDYQLPQVSPSWRTENVKGGQNGSPNHLKGWKMTKSEQCQLSLKMKQRVIFQCLSMSAGEANSLFRTFSLPSLYQLPPILYNIWEEKKGTKPNSPFFKPSCISWCVKLTCALHGKNDFLLNIKIL